MGRSQAKFQHTVHGPADDLGATRYRSRWERNLARVLNYLRPRLHITLIEYEHPDHNKFPFVGGQYRRNTCFWCDFRVIVRYSLLSELEWFIEPKGFLRHGGRLVRLDGTRLDISSLKTRDTASYVKLRAMQIQYPEVSQRLWIVGEREYRWLERRYAQHIPSWECDSKTPKAARPPTAPSSLTRTGSQESTPLHTTQRKGRKNSAVPVANTPIRASQPVQPRRRTTT